MGVFSSRVVPTPTHLVVVPVGKRWWNLYQQCAFVYGEVEVGAVTLDRDVMPVLVIQQAAQRHPVLAVGRGTAACRRTTFSEMKIRPKFSTNIISR